MLNIQDPPPPPPSCIFSPKPATTCPGKKMRYSKNPAKEPPPPATPTPTAGPDSQSWIQHQPVNGAESKGSSAAIRGVSSVKIPVCDKMMGLCEAASHAPPPALFVQIWFFCILAQPAAREIHVCSAHGGLTFVLQAASRPLPPGLCPVALGSDTTAAGLLLLLLLLLVRCPCSWLPCAWRIRLRCEGICVEVSGAP